MEPFLTLPYLLDEHPYGYLVLRPYQFVPLHIPELTEGYDTLQILTKCKSYWFYPMSPNLHERKLAHTKYNVSVLSVVCLLFCLLADVLRPTNNAKSHPPNPKARQTNYMSGPCENIFYLLALSSSPQSSRCSLFIHVQAATQIVLILVPTDGFCMSSVLHFNHWFLFQLSVRAPGYFLLLPLQTIRNHKVLCLIYISPSKNKFSE